MPLMPLMRARVRIAALFATALLGLVAGACTRSANLTAPLFGPTPTPTATHTPTATPTPTSTPTPTPTPTPRPEVRVASGDRALFNGDWDQAQAEYEQALRQAPSAEVAAAAQFGLAATHLRSGAVERAIGDLNLYLQAYPNDAQHADAYFSLGDAYLVQGTWDLAIQNYETYLQLRPDVIDSYVLERIGGAQRENGDYAQAARAYELAIVAARAGNLNFLLLDKADALLRAGDPEGALAMYDLVDKNTEYSSTRAEMDLRRGRVYLQLGDTASAYELFGHAVATYPESYNSYSAMLALLDAGIPIDDFQQGLVNYHAGEYVAAVEAFDRYLLAHPEHTADAHYYRALSYRALGNLGAAQDGLREIIDTHPDDPLWEAAWEALAATRWAWGNDLAGAIRTYLEFADFAPEHADAPHALSQAAALYERSGDLKEAAETWGKAADVYPLSAEAPPAAFKAGVSLYRQSLPLLASERFEQAANMEQAGAELRSAALMWLGKSASLLADAQAAREAWQAAAAADPGGYYSLRAEELLKGQQPLAGSPGFSFEFDEGRARAEAEDWLAARLGVENDGRLGILSAELAADGRWVRGSTLWRLGHSEDAKNELDALWRGMRDDPLGEYQLALAMRDLGYYYGAIWSARSTLDALGLTDTFAAPLFFTYLRYGPYYQDLIAPAAVKNRLDPLLVYALIRQESLFQGAVVSQAYAQGLMQIIPETGNWIAAQLGWPNYDNTDLFRPFINVQFGAYYLAAQRDYFDGHMFAALAAYNAGPGNAEIWHSAAGDDYDLFVEVVRLDEPQRYLRRVYEHYAVYRDLYGR